MASQSLYRKWRSQTFADLVGQEAIVRTLCHAVRDGRLAHAYLFCGPRGTGKTSVARLLAKAVNCANPKDGEPCNQCTSCREIAEGRSPDVFEIDAASNNGVDNIRELRDNVNILSTGGHYKVYIIDEVHMLSTAAFNAILKTLEEPPPHVLFVLATTEAHKVLATIVSRCQQFNFSRHSRRNIIAHLLRVAKGEGLHLERAAADVLARAAQGGMRDALSLLDQAMAFCGTEITLDGVRGMLGLAGSDAVRALVEHVAAERSAEGLHLINELVTSGVDLRQLNSQVAEFWRALFLARAGADVAEVMDCGAEEAAEHAALAARFSLDELTACARVFAANDTPARGLPVPQLGLELSFLECLSIRRHAAAPTQATQPASQPARPSAPAAAAAPPTRTTTAPAPVSSPAPPPAAPSRDPLAPASAQQPAPREVEELDFAALDALGAAANAVDSGANAPPAPSMTAMSESVVAGAHPASSVLDAGVADNATDGMHDGEGMDAAEDAEDAEDGTSDWLQRVQAQWELVKKVCRQKRRTVAALLHSARPIMVAEGNPLEIVLQADYEFHLNKLREAASRADVEWALAQVLERPCHVRLVLAGSGGGGSGGDSSAGMRIPGGPGDARAPVVGPDASTGSGRAPAPRPDGGSSATPHEPPNARANGHANGATNGHSTLAAAGFAQQIGSNGHVHGNGNGAHPQPRGESHNGAHGIHDGGLPAERAYTAGAPARPPAPDVALLREMEEEARADSLVREIMRAFPADLVEVRMLNHDHGE